MPGDRDDIPTWDLMTPGGGLDFSRSEQLVTIVIMVSAKSGATELSSGNGERKLKVKG